MKVLLAILVTISLAGCSTKEPPPTTLLGVRHQESGENTYFRFGNKGFDQYIATVKRKIIRNRVDITDRNQDKILAANSPFEWRPDPDHCQHRTTGKIKHGVLLMHGLSDSPYLMQDLARYFQRQCYLVRGLLLPGHGTVPGDLLKTRYEEWVKAAEYGINSFSGLVDDLTLVGFSTGGALSVYHALKRDDIASVLLFSPALQIKSEKIFLSGTVKVLSGVVDSLTWVDIAKDEDYAKYESFPINAAYQIYRLTQRLEGMLAKKPLEIPVFIVASQDDATIETRRTLEFFKQQINPRNKMVLYTNEPGTFKTDRMILKPGRYDSENITELSHLALLTAPENAHYGRHGDYRNCVHYLQKPEKMERCKTKKHVPAGEILESKLEGPVFRRVTYNPDFKGLLKEIDLFLESVH